MIFAPLFLSLAVTVATPSATVDTTRVAFAQCLRAHLKKSLEAKMADTDYEAAIKTVCTKERDAFRAAVVVLNRATGFKAADAEEDAEAQVNDYYANFSDKFMDYSASNTMPVD